MADASTPKLRWYRVSLPTLVILSILGFALGVFLLCGVRLGEAYVFAVVTAAVSVVAGLGFRVAKRHRFQYSLRTLFLITLACSLVCSYTAVRMQKAKRQREAVKAFAQYGLQVVYDYQCDISLSECWKEPEPPGPEWLRNLVGIDFLCNAIVLRADFGGDSGDIDFIRLNDLPCLQGLSLDGLNVNDSALVHVKQLTGLKSLILSNTHVTDAGLLHLKELSHLRNLELSNTLVTDQGVKRLQQALPNCKITRE